MTPISRSRNSSVDLLRVLPQALDVGVEVGELQHLHAALHPAQEGLLLVAAEVVADLVAQDGADRAPRGLGRSWPVCPAAPSSVSRSAGTKLRT